MPDGTEVFFFTTLGRVDESGKTRNGVARVNFVSDARSGKAPSPRSREAAPTIATTTLATGRAGAVAAASGGHRWLRKPRPPGLPPRTAVITIGSGSRCAWWSRPIRRTSRPDVRRLLRATVFDVSGNPVQNVPCSFSVNGATERLDSGGAFLFTNSNGQVTDTLRTSAPVGSAGTFTVTATTANGVPGTVTVSRE